MNVAMKNAADITRRLKTATDELREAVNKASVVLNGSNPDQSITREWFAKHIGRGSQNAFYWGAFRFSLFTREGEVTLRMVAEYEHDDDTMIEIAVANNQREAKRLIQALCCDEAFQG